MTDAPKSFHPSFSYYFCVHLEYVLSIAFTHSKDEELIHFWCDGVLHALYYKDEDNYAYLSYENICQQKSIATTAWLGRTGQDVYEMTIMLGEQSLKRYKAGESMIDCIPGVETTEWVTIDPENKTIKIQLH